MSSEVHFAYNKNLPKIKILKILWEKTEKKRENKLNFNLNAKSS